MDNEKELENLVSKADKLYFEYLNENNLKDVTEIYSQDDLDIRKKEWEKYISSIQGVDNQQTFEVISNPFFIGYGNPNADILIIGKEKGFNYSDFNYSQFYNESFNNCTYWKNLVSKQSDICFDQCFNNPLHPYFYNPKLSSGHTWRKYCQIVSEIKAMELGFDKDNSFLNHCFITEMNHVPSKTSKGRLPVLNRESYHKRIAFLEDDFFKKFKYVINTAKAYETIGLTEKLFDLNWSFNDYISGGDKLYSHFFSNKERKGVVTYQMSGSQRHLSTDAIKKLCELLVK